MADSIRYPLDSKQDVNRSELIDRATYIVGGPDDDPPRTAVIDAALEHLVESYENMNAMKEAGTIPGSEERDRWETQHLRFALYPRIRSTRGSHK